MRCPFLFFVLCSLLCGQLPADSATRFTIQRYQPRVLKADSTYSAERFDTSVVWVSGNKSRMEDSKLECYLLAYADSDVVYSVCQKFEIFQVIKSAKRGEVTDSITPESDLAAGLATLMPDQLWTIEVATDTMTIRGEPCRRVQLVTEDKYGRFLSDIWITTRESKDLRAFQLVFYGYNFPLNTNGTFESALKQISGFPMLEVARGKIQRTTEIVSIDTVSIDSTFFNIPAGYEEYKP